MCITLAGAALALSAAGTAVSAIGAIQQGQAGKQAASFNAQVARNNEIIAKQNEEYAIRAGIEKARRESMKGRVAQGKIKAQQAASGIDTTTGSALDVQEGAREASVLDTATVLHNAQLEAYGYRSKASNYAAEAELSEMKGDAAETEGYSKGLGSLLSGASSVGEKWAKL